MKLALFSTLVLALSTLRSVAMPSIIPEDAKIEDHQSKELSILDIDADLSIRDIDAAALGPWGTILAGAAIGAILGAAISVPVGIAVGLSVNKIQKWLDTPSPQRTIDTALPVQIVKPDNGESFLQMAVNYAKLLSQKLASDVGLLVAEKDAIRDVQIPGYDWLPLVFHQDQSNYIFVDLFVSRFPGYVQAYVNKPAGSSTTEYIVATGGTLAQTMNNFGRPDAYWTYSFGRTP